MTFYNIFKNNSEKTNGEREEQKEKIIVDNREKNSLVPSHLSKLGYSLVWEQLVIGDYLIKNIAIERKTISDFKSSIINKRLLTQIRELQKYPSNLLIIEGSQEELTNNEILHENAIRGFLLFLARKEKIPFLFSKDAKETAIYLDLIARRKENQQLSFRPSKTLETKKEIVLYILEGFPGVGPIKAKKLLERFKSIESIIKASEEELSPILGKNAKQFKEILTFKESTQ